MSATTLGGRRSAAAAVHSVQIRFWLQRLAVVTCLLAAMGLVASFSTTVYLRIALDRSPYDDFVQHAGFLLGGLGLAAVVILLVSVFRPARRWLRFVIPVAFYASLLLVALVKFSPWGVSWMGATRGLDVGPFTFQPSELLKISLVLYLAQLLCWWRRLPRAEDSRGLTRGSRPAGMSYKPRPQSFRLMRDERPTWPELPKRCMLIILLAVGLTIIQPDLGTTGIILGASLITLVLAGVNWRHLVGFGLALVLLAGLVFVAVPDEYRYASQRLHTWLNPMESNDGAAYQITQARGALAVGGLWGRGFLESNQKMNRLPLSTKDFVFPVMVEELGFAGGVWIILLFVALAWAGLGLSRSCCDPFNQTAIAALGFTVCLQGLVNIGTTIGTLPLSGLTLPFFSEGGTSLVVSLLAVGTMAALALGELRDAHAHRRQRQPPRRAGG